MRKSSSDSSKNTWQAGGDRFKKDKSSNPYKKNYDGRSPVSGAGSRQEGAQSSRPYSGRSVDTGTPPFGKENKREGNSSDRKPSKDFSKPFSDRSKKPYGKSENSPEGFSGERKAAKDFSKPFSDRSKKSYRKSENSREGYSSDRKPAKDFSKPFSDRPKRPYGKSDNRDVENETRSSPGEYKKREQPFRRNDSGKPRDRKEPRDFNKPGKPADSRPFRERNQTKFAKASAEKKRPGKETPEKITDEKAPLTFSAIVKNAFNKPVVKNKDGKEEDHPGKRQQFEDKIYGELEEPKNETPPPKPYEVKKKKGKENKHFHDEDGEDDQEGGQKQGMPLNKYIAHSGECSRRDAAELVKQGKVKVNGELVLDPGYRVQDADKVTMSGKKLTPSKGMVYILLNKPKGFITTNEDPQGRKTVMQLVENSGVDRLFPVGRLDRDTSGLLLITNDGDLTQKLCHPSYNIKKVYQVTLDKPLTKADFEKIIEGVELEDGKAVVDALSYLEKKNELGLEIHSGKNRIVRRIFESLGYVVDKLDRVMYAGLTKKNLPRSKWRYLDEREVVLLKHFKS